MTSPDHDLTAEVYDRVCESHHAIDDFRMKLLGLLPVATGTGVFLLLTSNAELIKNKDAAVGDAFAAIGVFGVLFTLGLFAYELFGIKKCHYLIVAGRRLERDLNVRGQFTSSPVARTESCGVSTSRLRRPSSIRRAWRPGSSSRSTTPPSVGWARRHRRVDCWVRRDAAGSPPHRDQSAAR